MASAFVEMNFNVVFLATIPPSLGIAFGIVGLRSTIYSNVTMFEFVPIAAQPITL